jgi:hypothetical protein
VPEFLAEVYVSDRSGAPTLPRIDEVSRAAAALSDHGAPVHLVRQIHVPEEETCFLLFEAPSEDQFLDVAARCGLRIDNVVGVVSGRCAPALSSPARPPVPVRLASTQEES